MRGLFRFRAALLSIAVLAAACTPREADRVSGLSAQRTMLAEGYSLLYADATKIGRLELVLYVKAESQEFHDLVKQISGHGDALRKDLERIARDYPGVRIDLQPLPEMEKRKRFAIGLDKAFDFAPLRGRDRREYERTVLISMSGALNHELHLCRVMAAEEPDPGLKKFLEESERRYATLHRRVSRLLDREHFRAIARS